MLSAANHRAVCGESGHGHAVAVSIAVPRVRCQSVSEDRAELCQDQFRVALSASITNARSLRISAVTQRLVSASSAKISSACASGPFWNSNRRAVFVKESGDNFTDPWKARTPPSQIYQLPRCGAWRGHAIVQNLEAHPMRADLHTVNLSPAQRADHSLFDTGLTA